jgi:hypothetical protein
MMKITSTTVGTHHSGKESTVLKPLSNSGFMSAGKAVSVAAVTTIAATAARNPSQYRPE